MGFPSYEKYVAPQEEILNRVKKEVALFMSKITTTILTYSASLFLPSTPDSR